MNNEERKELALYTPIAQWFLEFLQTKHPRASIEVFDTHSQDLSDFLQRSKYKKYFREYSTYKIKVDIVGMVEEKESCGMAFIEVKAISLSLKDLSQLIGYCKIVCPISAFLISSRGIGVPLGMLLNNFKRLDILEYSRNHLIRIARWDESRRSINTGTVIPPFNHARQ